MPPKSRARYSTASRAGPPRSGRMLETTRRSRARGVQDDARLRLSKELLRCADSSSQARVDEGGCEPESARRFDRTTTPHAFAAELLSSSSRAALRRAAIRLPGIPTTAEFPTRAKRPIRVARARGSSPVRWRRTNRRAIQEWLMELNPEKSARCTVTVLRTCADDDDLLVAMFVHACTPGAESQRRVTWKDPHASLPRERRTIRPIVDRRR